MTRSAGSSRIIWINHTNAVLQGFTLTNGFASGVLLNAGSIFDCSILGSRDNRGGGGMVMSAGTVSNCLFQGNYDDGNSGGCGGIVMSGGLLTHCAIVQNRGGSSGSEVGGLRLSGGQVWNTLIVSNRYSSGGTAGGVALSGSAGIRNCLIAANEGIGLAQSGGTVQNCTVARNALQGLSQASGSATNTIIAHNNNGGANLAGAGIAYAFCCSPDLAHDPTGTGNINTDPGFAANGTGYGTNHLGGNFRLGRGSPCVGAGLNSGWMLSARDLDGRERLMGAVVDIGAYESLPTPGTLLIMR